MARLSELAANPHGVPRGDLYLAIASLYRSQAPQLSERERALMRDILRRLTGDVEMAIRIALAERLADDENAPLDLVLLLADDRIEVARPVIMRSRQLSDAELLSILDHAGEDHKAALAQRPDIGEPVCEALAKTGTVSVLVALLRNANAHIAVHTFEALVEKSQQVAALQGLLAQRSDLPPDLATRVCDWVSDALKDHIGVSHPEAAPATELRIDEATRAIRAPAAERDESAGSATKLVDKLYGAGQLRAGFLVRVLNQGQFDLFEIAFARLLEIDVAPLRRLIYREGPGTVALACRAVGIDRCVFPTVFSRTRKAHGARETLDAAARQEVEHVFATSTKAEALARLRSMAAN